MVSRTLELPRWLSPHLAWFAPLCLAFAPTALWLYERWTVSIYSNGHGLFVPFVVAYLVWDNLRLDPITEPDSSPWGFAFLGAGLLMLVLDAAIRTEMLAAAGLIVCLPGLSLLLLGAGRTRSLAFPLLISVFMLPIPAGFISYLHLALRHVSAVGASFLIELWGIPVLRDATLLAAGLVGLLLAHMARSWKRRIALLLSAVGLAILCNVIRVFVLTLIVYYYGVDPLKTPLHEFTGIAAFAVVLVALFAIADRTTLRSAPA